MAHPQVKSARWPCHHSIRKSRYPSILRTPTNTSSEIPDMHGSGLRARRHYDWYEQFHFVGHECYEVHPCYHNPGRGCHQCHSEWQKDWARFFKAEDLLQEAAADPERYLRETGLDMRQDFMGALLQGATWEVLAPHLQPPAGGKVRIHPARLAKHRLALAQAAVQV
jgi:hypothetical protein